MNTCPRSDETCRACICEGRRFIPAIPGVVCNCEGTGCSNEEHKETCPHGERLDDYCTECKAEGMADAIDREYERMADAGYDPDDARDLEVEG